MLDLQTHLLPENRDELRKLALRMGYATTDEQSALEAFLSDYRGKTELNRKILDHLLHDAFSDDTQTRAEVDLVLDPDPPEERIAAVLGKYPFRDVRQAYRNLMSLAEERIRFLSTRRCRHFLAAIAPQLLAAIAATADPDSTLVNLDKVSDSLGGKGVLWELFSFNPPSLRLYVELVRLQPAPVRHPDQQSGHDRQPDGQPGAGQAAHAGEHATEPGRVVPRRRRHRSRSCTASRTTSNSASASATSWAKKTSRPRPAACRISPRPAWRRSPRGSTSGWWPASASRW